MSFVPPIGCHDDAVDEDPVELEDVVLAGERFVGVELDRPQFVDLTVEDCDLSGVVMSSFAARRVQVMRTRVRDCVWGGGMLQDCTFAECPSERWSLRFSTLQRVTFTGCTFVSADFYGATFDKVAFERCDLSGAHFDNAQVKELTLRACTLLGVTGALSLRGASIDLDDLPGLAPSLAREAGLMFNTDD